VGWLFGDGTGDARWPPRRHPKITVCDTSRFTLGSDLNRDVSFSAILRQVRPLTGGSGRRAALRTRTPRRLTHDHHL